MAPIIQRIYSSKDVDMLIAASSIADTAITNKDFLQSNRSIWADPFFDDLKNDIDVAIQTHLGLDNAKDLRLASIAIKGIHSAAINDLALVKVQINEDFKDNKVRRTEILNELGFTAYLKPARRNDQEALINLLYQFKSNLTPALRTEIVSKGTADDLLTQIVTYADNLKEADITQEDSKGIRKVNTVEAITDFNAIYSRVISVSKIASKLFKGSPAIQQQFSFYRIIKTMNRSKPNPNPPIPPTS